MLEFRQASGDAELARIFQLRYEVYCLEKKFLRAEDYPDGIERDEFDDDSVHFVALDTDDSAQLLGSFRLILPSEHGFPCERHFLIARPSPDPQRTAELSRMVIAPQARPIWRHILMGLSKEVYLYTRANSVEHCYAALERPLLAMLKRLGLPFEPVGEPGRYFNTDNIPTIPTILTIGDMEASLPRHNRWLWDYLQAPRDEQPEWF
jgi:N-acyl-L-homoserine lactone synthetase